ncbi:transposase [Clostridium cadaveris]|uniref:transposase n=1 Tax=Clostridium cadaveris TaxID=1529 RepID=UPI0003FBD80D|nr:transposase [Clostridium cadaveris]
MIRQEILNIVDLFTAQHLINFYENLFDTIDLSFIPEFKESKLGSRGYSQHALLKAFIVMQCEKFKEITKLHDFLSLNLKISHMCGFDITKPIPSYTVLQRFIKNFDNNTLKKIMKNQVNSLKKLEIIDNSVVSVDTTPILANTKFNNPKCFSKNKFNKENHLKSDKNCKLGVHTANNEDNDKNYTFYWEYKNLIMCDTKSGLPIFEVTLTGEKADVATLNDFLDEINIWFSLKDSKILADKGFYSRNNYNHIKDKLKAHAFIAKNKRNSKTNEKLSCGNPLCEAGLAMHKDGKQYLKHSIKQKYCCPFRTSTNDSSCPCNHPKYNNGHKNRGCVKYESIGIDYRASVDDTSDYFKQYYSLRIESERYNSRFKNLNFEKASVRNMASIANLNTIGHICLLSVALAAVLDNKADKLRSLSQFKRTA